MKHAADVLADDVELQIDDGSGLDISEIGVLVGVGDDANRYIAFVALHIGLADREAHAVNGDGPFVHAVIAEVLENMHCFRSASTAHAADDHEFGHVRQFSHFDLLLSVPCILIILLQNKVNFFGDFFGQHMSILDFIEGCSFKVPE